MMKKKFLIRVMVYLLLPVIVTEALLRLISIPNQYYLSKLDPFYNISVDSNYTYYYFIGSSHVAAAINADVFNMKLEKDRIKVVNAGRGTSTSMIFYLALKKMAEEGKLHHAVVFLESPGGGPASYADSKYGEWVKSENTHLLVPFLDFRTFIDFWKMSDNDFPTKIDVSLNYLTYTSRILSLAKEMFKENSLGEIIEKIKLNLKTSRIKEPEKYKKALMVNKGGIKIDQVSIQRARELAYTYFGSILNDQRRVGIEDLKNSVLNEINNLLTEHNCKLVLFNIPLSSVERQIHTTEIAKENFANLKQFISNAGISYLDFDFSCFTDDDFPDLWHLSYEKSKVYSNMFFKRFDNMDQADFVFFRN